MTMARRNRVDPWGDIHSVAERGIFTGNRGCLVGDDGCLARHHRGNLWIICQLKYRGWSSPLDQPGHWTPLFFLDEAVALAAGHRPCGLCRRSDYRSYRTAAFADADEPDAVELNRLLATERLSPGRGLDRARHRRLWRHPVEELPPGTVIAGDPPVLLTDERAFDFTFAGWVRPRPRPVGVEVDVLTPPLSVRALGGGYRPVLHATAVPT